MSGKGSKRNFGLSPSRVSRPVFTALSRLLHPPAIIAVVDAKPDITGTGIKCRGCVKTPAIGYLRPILSSFLTL